MNIFVGKNTFLAQTTKQIYKFERLIERAHWTHHKMYVFTLLNSQQKSICFSLDLAR